MLWIRTLRKPELNSLINDVKHGDAEAIAKAVEFVVAESLGLWHNRARAKICRYFKNHPPAPDECRRMVDAIVERLTKGQFYQQFKDQLTMAIRFAPDRMAASAAVASSSDKEYIQRYANWVRHALYTVKANPNG